MARRSYSRESYQSYQSYQAYINGNTARSLEPEPDYWDDREAVLQRQRMQELQQEEEEQRLQEVEQRKRRKRERALAHNLDVVSLLVMVLAIGITMWTLTGYLSVNSDLTNMSKQIASMKNEIIALENDNEAALTTLKASIDLDEIYRIATEELGMVHASKNKVIEYESTKSDYVKQYSDVPDVEADSLLDELIAGVKKLYD